MSEINFNRYIKQLSLAIYWQTKFASGRCDNDRIVLNVNHRENIYGLCNLSSSLIPSDIMKHVAANLVVGTRHLESPSTLLSRRTNELLVGEGLLTLRRTSRQINNKKKLESLTREGVAYGINIFSQFVYYSDAADNIIIPLFSFLLHFCE